MAAHDFGPGRVRSGADGGHRGFHHEAFLYGSDAELLEAVVPFLTGGIEAGEPTLAALDALDLDAVRSAMPDSTGVTFMDPGRDYANPAATIKNVRELLAGHVAGGATQVRMVGAVPNPGTGAPWDGWARYEAVINHAYDEFPVWGLCLYDTRTTPDQVLADIERTHPDVADGDRDHNPNGRYQDPRMFLTNRPPAPLDPIETTPPAAHLLDPSLTEARHALGDLADQTHIDGEALDGLILAADEALANSMLYGQAPVEMRAWTAPDRVVVAVSEKGPGPSDPFVGLVPMISDSYGGLGLWIAHQICSQVTLDRTGGFSVHLTAGIPIALV